MSSVFDRVQVMYPRGLRTGGPEALHQLVDALRAGQQDAHLVPFAATAHNERATAFDGYDAPETSRLDDRDGTAVVVPEGALHLVRGLKKAQPIIWWLSIDNSAPFLPSQERKDSRFAKLVGVPHTAWSAGTIPIVRRHVAASIPWQGLFDRSLHLTQSAYARAFLQSGRGLVGAMVTDYIPSTQFESAMQRPSTARGRTVAYNPRKAPWVPALLAPLLPGIQWRPIEGLDRQGVVELLASTAVYFDPGFHPGRDRMPREAALLGAVTIVARRGSGAYWEDVPIPWEHKVTPDRHFAQSAARAISDALDDLASAVASQDEYRRWISDDERRFRAEVDRVFGEGRFGDDSPIRIAT